MTTNTIIRLTLILACCLAGSACSLSQVHFKKDSITTVILIRHADRHHSSELNELGRQRAQLLVDEVKDMNISAIYSPDIKRNLDTVRPLAEHLGIEVTLTPKFTLLAVDDITNEIVTKYAGKTVLVVGNVSGNLQAMYAKFGGSGEGPLKYGDLYIIKIHDHGSAEVIKRYWGPPSEEEKASESKT